MLSNAISSDAGHGASELHLSLNAGYWDYDIYGTPPLPGVVSGVELWSWLHAPNTSETDVRWNGLRNALAGFFCASHGSLDSQRTTVPNLSFRYSTLLMGPHELRHATLLPMPVCTYASGIISVRPSEAQLDPPPYAGANGALSYDMAAVTYPFDLSFGLPTDAPVTDTRSAPAVSIKSTITGSAHYSGGLLIQLSNAQNDTLRFVTLCLHTLDLRLGVTKRPDLLESLSYTPPSELTRTPTTLEPILRLSPLSRITLAVKLERSFLLYTQHPPDAQRGWALPPAVVIVLGAAAGRDGDEDSAVGGEQAYARALLADLATPDFSMPYNVIIMSSTLVALLFGNVFNLLIRAFVVVPAG
ncbi:hypothetical protein AURDEDRAFT_173463 [Auricularia subglabra TFB-10046 SS5]|nr:hypothetical protein AURDEDRAFT_173463 [Auricularia subglabra TFB-10046 SS5]